MSKSLTAIGGNLYQIAAVELGDATQWVRIAQLNGIVDPFLTGETLLLIPDRNSNAGGGGVPQ